MFNISVDSTKSDAISELDRRLKNPFWSGFAIAWITWNWRVWYLTFFVSESLTGDKIVKIQEMYEYFGWHPLPGVLLNWIVIPICISGMITFWLPKLTDQFLKKQKENKEREDEILRKNLKSEEKNVKAMTELLEAEKKKFEAEKKKMESELKKLLVEKEKQMKEEAFELAKKEMEKSKNVKNKTEQELWDDEYISLVTKFPGFWKPLTKLIYDAAGHSLKTSSGSKVFDPGEIQLLDVNALVEVIDDKSGIYKITDKGKYFLKKQSLI